MKRKHMIKRTTNIRADFKDASRRCFVINLRIAFIDDQHEIMFSCKRKSFGQILSTCHCALRIRRVTEIKGGGAIKEVWLQCAKIRKEMGVWTGRQEDRLCSGHDGGGVIDMIIGRR
eukprot:NODE_6365_length_643_cov_0.957364_g6342_i0.p2 GENE.NODE_6365_length_643_cov_0.957364_g6342_i0~~NODE_6365_length_643_cov_0.957364_g6342_i0.p2  ORF type:complete len:117 (+),score=7.81 NODE_6365_length_643_cov_0.957364_g6342_i0:263-613(+)